MSQAQKRPLLEEAMSWKALKPEYVDLYAQAFTDEELRGLVEFYRSPVGKRLVEKTPELTTRSMQLIQARLAKVLPQIQDITREWAREMKDARQKAAGDE